MAVQLEFNLDNRTPEEMQIYIMQKQIDEFCDSMGKVRRRLFSEMGEMKKICMNLQQENEELKSILNELRSPRAESQSLFPEFFPFLEHRAI